ncbi:hypothetical protein OB13_01975 [Pontibacter sp. HJ8]
MQEQYGAGPGFFVPLKPASGSAGFHFYQALPASATPSFQGVDPRRLLYLFRRSQDQVNTPGFRHDIRKLWLIKVQFLKIYRFYSELYHLLLKIEIQYREVIIELLD